MELYPAIDIMDGRCVRLLRGDFAQETLYADDPVAVARQFDAAGARWLHVVDLDAARTGEPRNRDVVGSIARGVRAEVQSGGGVRTQAAAEALLASGVARVVVGTAALEDPDLLRRLAGEHPGRVALGLDARDREVALRGWVAGSGTDVLEALGSFEGSGVAAVVVTQINVDGTLEGPDFEGLGAVLAATSLPVVASGGVGTIDDLRGLAALESAGRRLEGAIVGRAIYEGAFTLGEALAVCHGGA